MKILIDIGHPAHVHLFKNFAWEMQDKGHEILFTLRQKEFSKALLEQYGFEFKQYGSPGFGLIGKIWGLVKFNVKLYKIVRKFSPNFTISHGSFYLSQVSWMLRKKNITLEDTGNMEQICLYKPFSDVILTPSCYLRNHGKKQLYYNGYHELSYLHPDRFSPNPKVLKSLDVKKNDSYVIMRFVSWGASHDKGHSGISLQNKIRAVKEFSKYAKVFISSEKELPLELESYRMPISPEKMHDALAFAKLVWGESATMAAEAAVLETPAVYLDNTGRYYTRELESKYGLVHNFSESEIDQLNAIEKGIEILKDNTNGGRYKNGRKKMLTDKIDVTAFLVWFIENYPKSIEIVKGSPGYQQYE